VSPTRSAKRWLAIALAFGLAVVALSRCSLVRFAYALSRSTDQFIQNRIDPRVFYTRGAESMADVAAADLPAAVALVEDRQAMRFAIPVRVYICATIDEFTSYGASPDAGGFTLDHRVFISPKAANTPERMPRLLAHELSHLLLFQRLGVLDSLRVPVWFTEGLAVEVSGGGGAEQVSEPEARETMRAGRVVAKQVHGSLLHRNGALASGLSAHLFYRESALIIAAMRARDGRAFDDLVQSVADGADLGDAFYRAYHADLDSEWERLVTDAAREQSSIAPLPADRR
jgi:hypothetical protein